jgi:Rrf2 family transcriptional regulator, iron-sulfur cluster assembly transcription factor
MLLTRKVQYAVQALVDLSCHSRGKPVALKDIAQREGIPLPYLEQLFFRLKKGLLVTAVRGPGGGYLLARLSSAIRISDIIATVEEPLRPVACMDERKECDRNTRCAAHGVWHDLGARITSFLNGITLEDLVREARKRLRVEGEPSDGGLQQP